MPFNKIPFVNALIYNFETTDFARKWLIDFDGNTNTKRLRLLKVIVIVGFFSISFILKDEYFLILVAGTIVGPVIGFILPVSLTDLYALSLLL